MVIVIAVIAILAAALIPTFGGLIESANESAAMQKARQALNDYILEETTNNRAVATEFYITSGKYTFEVTNGQLNTNPVEVTLTACDAKLDAETDTFTAAAGHQPDANNGNKCSVCGK